MKGGRTIQFTLETDHETKRMILDTLRNHGAFDLVVRYFDQNGRLWRSEGKLHHERDDIWSFERVLFYDGHATEPLTQAGAMTGGVT